MPTITSSEVRVPNGSIITVYPISKLASALERSTLTIRRWEREGIIPDTFFTSKRGHRMYSQDQIDIIVQCAEEAGIKRGSPIADTEFSVLCHERLKKLKDSYCSRSHP